MVFRPENSPSSNSGIVALVSFIAGVGITLLLSSFIITGKNDSLTAYAFKVCAAKNLNLFSHNGHSAIVCSANGTNNLSVISIGFSDRIAAANSNKGGF